MAGQHTNRISEQFAQAVNTSPLAERLRAEQETGGAADENAAVQPQAQQLIKKTESGQSGSGLGHLAKLAGHSFLHAAVQAPAEGLVQLVNKGAENAHLGKVLPDVHLVEAPERHEFGTWEWGAQTIGSGVGMVAPFLITEVGMHGMGRAARATGLTRVAETLPLARQVKYAAPVLRPTATGAAFGFVFTPVNDEEGSFLGQRSLNAAVGGLTFGTQRGLTLGAMKGLSSALGKEVTEKTLEATGRGMLGRVGINMGTGAIAGGVSAESHSILSGHGLAKKEDVLESMGAFTLTGGVLDLAHFSRSYVARRGWRQQATGEGNAQTAGKDSGGSGDLSKTAAEQSGGDGIVKGAGGGSGSMAEVQARMSGEAAGQVRQNSPALIKEGRTVSTTFGERLSQSGLKAQYGEHMADVQRMIDRINVREHDGVGMDVRELRGAVNAVNRLLSAEKLIVDLTPEQRLGLAKQLLYQAGDPLSVTWGSKHTRGLSGIEMLVLDRNPGMATEAIVDLLTTGKYESKSATKATVDLNPESLKELPPAYRNVLSPDGDALASLERAQQAGFRPTSATERSYASQLLQILAANLHTQNDAKGTAIYVQVPEQTRGDSGEFVFRKGQQGYKSEPFRPDEAFKTDDLQKIFDRLSGVDNSSLVLKNGTYFLVLTPEGMLKGDNTHSRFGLYGNDSRFLQNWQITLNGEEPLFQSANVDRSFTGNFKYTNKGSAAAPEGSLALDRDVVVTGSGVTERLQVKNVTEKPITVDLGLQYGSDFVDMFEVRGFVRNKRGTMLPAEVSPDRQRVGLGYDGIDNYPLRTYITWKGENGLSPKYVTGEKTGFQITLAPGEQKTLEFAINPRENTHLKPEPEFVTFQEQLRRSTQEYRDWMESGATIATERPEFNAITDRAYRDLYMLKIPTVGGETIAAGIPWFASPFGRDPLVTGLQTVEVQPNMSKGILEQLAALQGTKDNPVTAEKPGKIMHELRVGEMARNREVPFHPYYGTIDATPLWLMLLGRYVEWTGDTALVKKLEPNIKAALEYLDAETAESGYLRYGGKANEALSNQGWKDSGDSVMYANGDLAQAPIALSEPQGYLYAAWRSAAKLAEQSGDHAQALKLYGKAESLKERFNNDFWVPGGEFAALGLDAQGKQMNVVASNMGHLIMTGVLTPEHAFAVQERLMKPDMYSGFGIRTLSSRERRYNPNSYHNGSIWPHDNSMIAAGMHDLIPRNRDSVKVMEGLIDAAIQHPDYRLPELFGGFPRDRYGRPIPYPVSSSPQAWAAGSMLQLLRSNMGLHANAQNNSLLIFKPTLPESLGTVDIKGLRVGPHKLHVRFLQQGGRTVPEVVSNPGNVSVHIEQ